MTARIDVHQHLIPPFYRDVLLAHGLAAPSGRALPDWSVEEALAHMDTLEIATSILSVTAPSTTFLDGAEAAAMAQRLNDFTAELDGDRFGYFAVVPMPDVPAAAAEARRALDEGGADGVVLLANSNGRYLGTGDEDELWRVLDERGAVAFVHPADLPAPVVDGIPPFAADFLLDTTRAAYLLVRNGVVRRFPNIRFILSHGGGFLPYASHRMALTQAADVGRSPLDVLDDFRSFYFDTALSSSPAALPTLLEFAKPGRVLFGSDFPFAPTAAGQYFVNGLESGVPADVRAGIDRANAAALLPRLGGQAPKPDAVPMGRRARAALQRRAARAVFRLVQSR